MRRAGWGFRAVWGWMGCGLAVGLAAAPGPVPAPKPATPPAPTVPAVPAVESPIRTDEWRFDVFSNENRKVGHMRLKAMTVSDLVVVEEEFAGPPFKGQEVGFDSQVVYRGTGKPALQRAKATTRLGGFKIMEGSLTFTPAAAGWTVKEEFAGYADEERKPFAKPLRGGRESPVTGDLVLTHAAFLFMAPRLLTRPGQIEKVVYMQLPPGFAYPNFVKYHPDATLTRSAAADDGRVEFSLKRVYAGGNTIPVMSMTQDRDGKTIECRLDPFVFRPEAPEGAAKPPAPPNAPASKTGR